MKKSILMISLVMVFGLCCNTSLWAGNGSGMKDGSMLDVDLTATTLIEGVVYDAGTSGAGLSIDEGEGVITTVYGMGSSSFWDSLGVAKPMVSEPVSIDAVEVTFSDGSTRLIAVSLTVDSTFVELRTADGPAWRGINKQSGTSSATGDCGDCPNSGTCNKSQGNGTGTCPLAED